MGDGNSKKRKFPTSVDDSESLPSRRARLHQERKQLPIWSARERFLEQVQQSRVLILVGETGSGKTTQIPQYLHHGGWSKGGAIACTQPRRVAAVTVARRVAEEMGVQLGQLVGYSIRFDDATSAATRVKYMTDGMLLREALLDPDLSKYRVVIIDEAHERTVQTDVLLGLLQGVLRRRGDDFRLIVMSATLDAGKFADFFGGAKAAYIQGRQFPVQVLYTAQPQDNYLDAAFAAVLQVHAEGGPGDVLVFLTGQEEIESLERLLSDEAAQLEAAAAKRDAAAAAAAAGKQGSGGAVGSAGEGGAAGGEGDGDEDGGDKVAGPAAPLKLLVCPIYAAMPPEQQLRVFAAAPAGYRKVILATNIAETSLTIPGVRHVIDSGFVKSRSYNARLGSDSLQVVPVSQAQARQRSGRAGREAPGTAYRLYTEASFQQLPATTPPEIQRSNLGAVVLQLKALGIHDVVNFPFLDPPPRAAVVRSLELLYALGALDGAGRLTEAVGRPMVRLPVEPMVGRVLLAAGAMGCALEAMQLMALISADGAVFYAPRAKREAAAKAKAKFLHREGDHLTLLTVYRMYCQVPGRERAAWCSDNFVSLRTLKKASDILAQLQRHLTALALPIASCGDDTTPLRRALTAGLFPHAARRQPDGTYSVISTGQQIHIHPSSVLHGKAPACVVFDELVTTTKNYARGLTVIEPPWLPELAPAFFAAKAGVAALAAALAPAAVQMNSFTRTVL